MDWDCPTRRSRHKGKVYPGEGAGGGGGAAADVGNRSPSPLISSFRFPITSFRSIPGAPAPSHCHSGRIPDALPANSCYPHPSVQKQLPIIRCTRKVLRIPDLEQSKHAVLNSHPAKTSQQSYGHAIDEFISWYCSEPRLAFDLTVVLRYRFLLEQKNLAPSTINVRLAAVRRLAYEAADTGLLSPELAAGIARVKGATRLGVRIGNWLTAAQGKALLKGSYSDTLRGKRDRAILAVLLGCGLRRAETVAIRMEDLQLREEHWGNR
jgi:hypothetical protein